MPSTPREPPVPLPTRSALGGLGLKRTSRGVDAERFGDDLREDGFVPLAGRLRDREERHVAVRVELDRDLVLGRGAAAARFEIGRDADAAKLARALRCRAARFERVPVRALERIFHHRSKIARVVRARVRRLVRHRLARNEILPAQLERIEAVLVRGVIDEALDRVRDVGTARAAIRRDRHGVRVCEPRAAVHRGNAIDAAHRDREVLGRDEGAERPAVGAEVGAIVPAYREETPSASSASSPVSDSARPWQSLMKVSVRVATHFTGRPSLRAAIIAAKYSGYAPPRTPKLPPTSCATIAILSLSSPLTCELAFHAADALQRNMERVAPACGSKATRHARGSSALPTRRWLSTVSLLTCFARANAAATASASPDSNSNARLPGTSA